jgi:hypothetical protein
VSGGVVLLCHGVDKSRERTSEKSVWVRSALSACVRCSGSQRVSSGQKERGWVGQRWQELELRIENRENGLQVTLRGADAPRQSSTGMALDRLTSVECAMLAHCFRTSSSRSN